MTEATFKTKHLKTLKRRYPKARHFVYIGLPKDKELSFTVEERVSLKNSMKDQLEHLKKTYGYEQEELSIETYDLRDM